MPELNEYGFLNCYYCKHFIYDENDPEEWYSECNQGYTIEDKFYHKGECDSYNPIFKKRFVDTKSESIEDQTFIDMSTDKYYFLSDGLDDTLDLLNHYYILLKKYETKLINTTILIRMLEDYEQLNIEEILYNLTNCKNEEDFNKLYKTYFDTVKKQWSIQE